MYEINIGDTCVECGESTVFGTGKFVNRIPAGYCDGAGEDAIAGYLCGDCLSIIEIEIEENSND
jgi:hypothetical protein|tara:strand:- start:1453 stop:1644 length:192 start_codon:yes stop_codon:yes gene_type:complete